MGFVLAPYVLVLVVFAVAHLSHTIARSKTQTEKQKASNDNEVKNVFRTIHFDLVFLVSDGGQSRFACLFPFRSFELISKGNTLGRGECL